MMGRVVVRRCLDVLPSVAEAAQTSQAGIKPGLHAIAWELGGKEW